MKIYNYLILIAVFLMAISSSCSKSDNTYTPTKNADDTPAETLTITGFTPTVAKVGATITITGTAFGNDGTLVGIKFGTAASIYPSSITNTQLTAIVPNDATDGPISIAVNNRYFIISKNNFSLDHGTTTVDYSSYNVLTYTGSAGLSVARFSFAAAGAGGKILFAGGSTDLNNDGQNAFNYRTACTDAVDIYNTTADAWTTSKLSEARAQLAGAAVGNKIVFAGGLGRGGYSKTVDIYDVSTGLWSTAQLAEARAGLTATASGNKIYFAGGMTANGEASKTVDIYDVAANTWAFTNLTNQSYNLGSASTGGKIAFVGGTGGTAAANDVFIAATLEREPTKATGNKDICRGAGNGNKMIFAGTDNNVDMYNASNNQWTTKALGQTKSNCAAVVGGTKIVLAGGGSNLIAYSKDVDVYDVTTDTWITLPLSIARNKLAGATGANKMVFAGGANGSAIVNTVDIFTLTRQ